MRKSSSCFFQISHIRISGVFVDLREGNRTLETWWYGPIVRLFHSSKQNITLEPRHILWWDTMQISGSLFQHYWELQFMGNGTNALSIQSISKDDSKQEAISGSLAIQAGQRPRCRSSVPRWRLSILNSSSCFVENCRRKSFKVTRLGLKARIPFFNCG